MKIHRSNWAYTFFLADQKEELNDSMEHFWEVETLGIPLHNTNGKRGEDSPW